MKFSERTPWTRMFWSDFQSDTCHLDFMHLGAYMKLLLYMYQHGKALPSDKRRLSRICNAMSETEMLIIDEVLREYFVEFEDPEDGLVYRHHRVEREMEFSLEAERKKREKGMKGAAARWGNDASSNAQAYAQAMPKHMPEHMPNHMPKHMPNHMPKQCQPEPEPEPELEEKEGCKQPLSRRVRDWASVEKIFERLNELTGSNFRTKNGKHNRTSDAKSCLARIEESSLEEVLRVVEVMAARWQGTDKQEYIRPSTLFGPKNFENYLGQTNRQPATNGIGRKII